MKRKRERLSLSERDISQIDIILKNHFEIRSQTIMAPPSQLMIATSSVNRLVKEEASYHKELEQQQASIAKLEQGGGDENAEFQLKQEVCGAKFVIVA